MKVIIIAVQSKWGHKILTKEKLAEIRKSIPKGFIGWVYIYITKALPFLAKQVVDYDDIMGYPATACYYGIENEIDGFEQSIDPEELLNGKIVARFWYDQYDKITNGGSRFFVKGKDEAYTNVMAKKSCLNFIDLKNYAGNKDVYAWHIKNLEVFDEPMELGDFWVVKTKSTPAGKSMNIYSKLTKAPQSWQYAYLKEGKV